MGRFNLRGIIMILLNQNRLKQALIYVFAVIVFLSALPCYGDEIFSEAVLGRLKFSFVQTGPEQFVPIGKEKISPDSDLCLQVTDSNTGQITDKYSLLHRYYGNSVVYSPELYALKYKDGSTQILLFFRYGGSGDHLENRLHWFEFSNGSLNKLGEQNISDPEIIADNGVLDRVKGNYVLTLCDVCDGWEASAPEDIFFIPIAVFIENHEMKVISLLSEDEKRNLMDRFNRQKDLRIKEISNYKGRRGERYKDFAESLSTQLDELME